MAEVRGLRAIRYDQEQAGAPLDALVAPPYDVIDDAMRAELIARSPRNIVEIDLPLPPAGDPSADRYECAGATLGSWMEQGVMVAEDDQSIWPIEQSYTGPDGKRRVRRGVLCRVRLAEYGDGIRAHERTQPGPKRDRLLLTRATRTNLSPIFSLYEGDAWDLLADGIGGEPWGVATDGDGTETRAWRLDDGATIDAFSASLVSRELLIADGHHRYETALAYRDERAESDGEPGEADFVLMALVGLDDPGLTVFPTHRLLTEVADDDAARERLGSGIRELFDVEEVAEAELDPGASAGVGIFGYLDAYHRKPLRLTLNDAGHRLVAEHSHGHSEAYRDLDAAILETVVLRHLLQLSEDDIAAKNGLAYTPSAEQGVAMIESGSADAGFFLRPTPIESIRSVASAGEAMPPKSTYFFPKLPTGIVLNPLG